MFMEINQGLPLKSILPLLKGSQDLKAIETLLDQKTIEAIVREVKGNNVLLQLLDGKQLRAVKENNTNLFPNQRLSFQVTSASNNQIQIRPIKENLSGEENLAKQAMSNAGIPINDKTLQLVFSLIKHKLPINKEQLQQAFQQSKSIPLEKLVLMKLNNIPVTETNATVLDHILGAGDNLADKLVSLLSNLESLPEQEQLELVQAFEKETDSKQSLPKNAESTRNPVGNNSDKEATVIKKVLNNIETTEKNAEVASKDLPTKEITKAFTKVLRSKFFMDIKQLKEGPLEPKVFYEDLEKSIQVLKETLGEKPHTETVLKEVGKVQEHMELMSQIKEDMVMVNLPLQMSQNLIHGNLIYNKNKYNEEQDSKEKTALIHLETAHLGMFRCYIGLAETQVRLDIGVERERTAQQIVSHQAGLLQILKSKGYTVSHFQVSVLEESDKDLVETILKPTAVVDAELSNLDIRV